jgi:histidinol-phosphatase
MSCSTVVSTDLTLAHLLADAADEISSLHFGSDTLRVETKADGSPVTAADRAVERRICDLLATHRPEDGFLGEEVGHSGPARRRWIIDGIDGTHNYVRSNPGWGTLIALEDGGEVMIGVMSSPALGRRWWAERGGGAWSGPISATTLAGGTALRCTTTDAIDDALIVVTPPDRYIAEPFVPVATALRRRDPDAQASFAHAALSVAEGDADAALVLRGGAWDYAAVLVIVEEAGGTFSDLWGGRRLDTGTAVYSNATLHPAILALAAGSRPAQSGPA